jgi:hypothetical protein
MSFHLIALRSISLTVFAACSLSAHAQLVNYSEQIGSYKDVKESGVRLTDGVFPRVSVKSRVNHSIAQQTLVDQAALVQPDGSLKLPENQSNIVIRTNYSTVQNVDGQLRIASPTIQGNVNGNVTLYVEGKGVENITILNNSR